jgi:hypothetical protein
LLATNENLRPGQKLTCTRFLSNDSPSSRSRSMFNKLVNGSASGSPGIFNTMSISARPTSLLTPSEMLAPSSYPDSFTHCRSRTRSTHRPRPRSSAGHISRQSGSRRGAFPGRLYCQDTARERVNQHGVYQGDRRRMDGIVMSEQEGGVRTCSSDRVPWIC